MEKVEGTINANAPAALESDASGGLWLQVNQAMAAGAGPEWATRRN
jgi:hypothetical protein